MKKTVSFLVSGRGSNFQAVAKAIIKGTIPAKTGVVISETEGVRALDIAQELSIPAFFINPRQYKSRQEHEKAMVQLLHEYSTDVVVTAGYMRLLTPYFVHEFKNSIALLIQGQRISNLMVDKPIGDALLNQMRI